MKVQRIQTIEAVTFDVTNTLIHSPQLGELYAEVLSRHGVTVTPDAAARLVREVWQELACLAERGRDRFTAHPGGPRGWWKRFLERMCERLEAPPPSPFAAAELFYRFATPEAWEVFPEVPAVLARLRARGLRLAVVSNWDPRLPDLLESLGLARSFDAIVYSSEVGVEKPDPRIFLSALGRLKVEPAAALHVGDGKVEDAEGAAAAGLHALLLDRRRGVGKGGDLHDLAPLPGLLVVD
ncbi:MAG TPA: HAD-IA family hydrolase [Thermoanaerobaculia bacterium]|jgi:putative hydrolase of the HAD superfamily|nr:HAD-IA family hydrolase [Thermoanaerobaculia bacterium]